MNVQVNSNLNAPAAARTLTPAQPAAPAAQPAQPAEAVPEASASWVNSVVDHTVLSANYLASGVSGGTTGLAAGARSVIGTTARVAVSGYKNLWKDETLGPNVKVIGSLLAAPFLAAGVVLALPLSLVAGVIHGVGQVDSSQPRELTVGSAAVAGYDKTRKDWQSGEKSIEQSFDDMGNRKLAPGEKPFDIPLAKLGKTLVVGAASAAVGGAAAIVSAGLSAGRQIGVGLKNAVTESNLNVAGRAVAGAGAIVGGVVQGATYGLGSGLGVLHRGVVDTWEKDSSVDGASSALKRTADVLKAAVSPENTLTYEAPLSPPNP